MSKRRLAPFAGLALVVLAVGGANAAIPDAGGVFHACARKTFDDDGTSRGRGELRIIDHDAGEDCTLDHLSRLSICRRRAVAATLRSLSVAALELLTSDSSATDGTLAPPSLSISNVSATEGDGPVDAVFTVRRVPANRKTTRVRFTTADGSAKAGSDYVATRGRLTFKPGERSKRINVSILGDTVAEAEETFFVVLSRPTNARIAKGNGRAVIRANDLPAPFTLNATMDGDQLVGPAAPGARGARGTFSATFDAANERFSFTITIEGMDEPIFAVHIHKGRQGEFGEGILQIVDPFPAQNGSTSGVKRLGLDRILEVFSNPAGFYAEVHPVDLTGGIRGQLSLSRG